MTTEITFETFTYPELNARIGIAVSGQNIAITFLSEGCSRSGKPGDYKYTRRNPARRKAAARLFEGPLSELIEIHTARAGKKDSPAVCVSFNEDATQPLAAFRSGGNYRFDLWGVCADGTTAEEIADALGLVPV